MSSNTAAVTSMAIGLMNPINTTLRNMTSVAGNVTWSEQAIAFFSRLSESSGVPKPAATAGLVLLGLAAAGTASCLSRAIWRGGSEQPAIQPRLQNTQETSEPAVPTDVSVAIGVIQAPESTTKPDGAAQPKRPAESATDSALETDSANQVSTTQAATEQSQPVPAKRTLQARTNAAIASKTAGFSNTSLEAMMKPRQAKAALLRAKQQQGMQGQQESAARRADIAQRRQAELSEKRSKVQAERARRAALRTQSAVTVSAPTPAPRKSTRGEGAAALAKGAGAGITNDLKKRTAAAVALKSQGSHPSQLNSVNNSRRAVAKNLRNKQEAGIAGRREHEARRAQIQAQKDAELARKRAQVAAIRGAR